MLTAADIAIKSPGDGLPPYYLDQMLGQTLTRDLRADETHDARSPSGRQPRPAPSRAAAARVSGRFGLEGRVAVVTGALGNLGPVWAEALLEAGADGRRPRPAVGDAERGVRQRCRRPTANRLTLIGASVTDRAALDAAREQVSRGLACRTCSSTTPASMRHRRRRAAAIASTRSRSSVNRRIFEVNTLGLFQVAQIFGTDMVKAGRGSVINIGSLYASVSPDPRFYDHIVSDPPFLKPPAYGASKAAVVNLTKYLATAWGPHGVRVNTLSPGGVLGGPGRAVQAQVLRPRAARPHGRLPGPDRPAAVPRLRRVGVRHRGGAARGRRLHGVVKPATPGTGDTMSTKSNPVSPSLPTRAVLGVVNRSRKVVRQWDEGPQPPSQGCSAGAAGDEEGSSRFPAAATWRGRAFVTGADGRVGAARCGGRPRSSRRRVRRASASAWRTSSPRGLRTPRWRVIRDFACCRRSTSRTCPTSSRRAAGFSKARVDALMTTTSAPAADSHLGGRRMKGDYLRNLLSNDDLRQYPLLVDFALSDAAMGMAAGYLGTIPHLNRVDLLYSIPRESDDKVSSQLFHVDPEGLTQVKFFINVFDVG